MTKNTVFDYLDYRKFLKDQYDFLKGSDKKYSQRYFMQKLGAKSTAFFAEILSGKRNLNHQNILRFIKLFAFDADEAQYFEYLVNFNQARAVADKDYWLRKMMQSSKVNVTLLNRDVYEYFSKWYFSAIRELIFYCKKPLTPKIIAEKLNPGISASEAGSALRLLEKLSLIEKLPDGSFKQKDTVISTGDPVASLEVARYQIETMDLAKKALDAVPVNRREISTLTMSISQDAYSKIAEILKKAKQDIVKTTQNDNNEDRVYQLNIQFFPLTKTDN